MHTSKENCVYLKHILFRKLFSCTVYMVLLLLIEFIFTISYFTVEIFDIECFLSLIFSIGLELKLFFFLLRQELLLIRHFLITFY